MRPSWVCVAMSQNVTVRSAEYAMNSLCFGRVMHEYILVSGTGHSETANHVDASNCLILSFDATRRWLSNQMRPVLYHWVSAALICPRASGHHCCRRLERNCEWLSRFDHPAVSISLRTLDSRGGVFVLVRALQYPKRWLCPLTMRRQVETGRARNRLPRRRGTNPMGVLYRNRRPPRARRLVCMSLHPRHASCPCVSPLRSISRHWTLRDTGQSPFPLFLFACHLPLARFEPHHHCR